MKAIKQKEERTLVKVIEDHYAYRRGKYEAGPLKWILALKSAYILHSTLSC